MPWGAPAMATCPCQRESQAEQQESRGPMAKVADGLRQKAADEWAKHPSNPANEEAQGAQAGEFQREDRYIVIKRKDLEAVVTDREWFKNALSLLDLYLPKREYLVIESDWPEYEPTWAAIQARAALATQPAAGEPEQQTAINADDLPTKKYPLGAFDFDAPVAAGEPVATVLSSRAGNDTSTIDKALPDGTKLFLAPPAAAHGDGLHFNTTEDLVSAISQVSAYEDLGPELIAEEMFKQAGASSAHGDEAVRAKLCEAYESGYQDGQKWPDSYSIQADKDKVADALIAAMRAQAGEGG